MLIQWNVVGLVLLAWTQSGAGQVINVAALVNDATCTASSSFDGFTMCTEAMDGQEAAVTSEWVSDRDGAEAFIRIDFNAPAQVNEVKFLQRCYYVDMAKRVRVFLDDNQGSGESFIFELSCDGGGNTASDCGQISWQRFPISSPIQAQYANIEIIEVCYPANYAGFREIVILGTPQASTNLAVLENGGTCEASSEEDDQNYECTNAIDNSMDQGSGSVWESEFNLNVGEWIKITLQTLSTVTQIQLLSRCDMSDQMDIVDIEFDSGDPIEADLECGNSADSNSCPEKEWDTIDVPNIQTTSIRIVGMEACSASPQRMGFAEVQVYGTPVPKTACPFNFMEVLNGTTCLRFISADVDLERREQAKSACAEMSNEGYLVEINSPEEQELVLTEIQRLQTEGASCSDYYIGGLRLDESASDWYWENQFELIPIEDRYWGPGQPTDSGLYMSIQYFPNGTQWHWASNFGSDQECFVCEAPITN